MRGVRCLAGLVGLVALTGCGVSQSKVDEAEGRASAAQSQLANAKAKLSEYEDAVSDMRSKVDALDTASQELDGQVDRFDSEDWSAVVSDVKDARDEEVSAKDEAVSGVEALEGVE